MTTKWRIRKLKKMLGKQIEWPSFICEYHFIRDKAVAWNFKISLAKLKIYFGDTPFGIRDTKEVLGEEINVRR